MLVRYLLLAVVAVSLLAYRASVRQGKGGFLDGLIREKLGELGAQGKVIENSLREQFIGKRVHYTEGMLSWSGKVIAVEVLPITEINNSPRSISVTVETTEGMGEAGGSSTTITLDQISGIMKETHNYVGSTIKVSYDDIYPAVTPNNPREMFVRGYPNTVVGFYTDGYLEVDVKGKDVGKTTDGSSVTDSGTVFIHVEDIIRDDNLRIVHPRDLESASE